MTTAITPLPPGPSLARVLWLSLRPLRDHSSFLAECHHRYGDPFSFPGLQGPVVTTCDTTAPPRAATSAAVDAKSLAWREAWALCCTVLVSTSIDEAVSSRLAAVCSVRWLRS